MVELSNYQDQGFGGFGSEQDVDQLVKAMQAGSITGRDTANQLLTMEPLKAESLEKTLKLLDFRMKDIQLWNSIPKLAAYNTVEEYLLLESYGSDRGGFYNEGELSDVEDSKYRRKAEKVKYIQVTGEVTYQAQLVNSYVDAMKKEVENKTMWVCRKTNGAIWKANESIVPQEFNGLAAQHANIGGASENLYVDLDSWQDSSAVIDLRGKSLTQNNLEDAAINIDSNFGNVDTLFAPPSVLGGLAKDYYQRQRILLNGGAFNGEIGVVPKTIDTTFGPVGLKHDKFMKKDPARKLSESATSGKEPNAPVSVSAALTGADAKSRFKTSEGGLGTVYYAVAAINRYGESALTVLPNATTPVTLTNGQSVDIKWTDGGGGNPATGYVVYRSLVTAEANASTGGVVFYPIFKVSTAQLAAGYDGAAATFVRDRNRFLPNTEEAFTTEMVDDVLSFKSLAPISKMDLAVLAMSRRFIVFHFGTPFLYTPKKMVRIINIGAYVAS
jgi:hypothetical protein